MKRRAALAALGAAAWPWRASAQALPAYRRVEGLAGTVRASGSSTVAALLKPVCDRFAALQPRIDCDIGGAGSSTAMAALLEQPDTLGLLSRPMAVRERERFAAKWGRAPVEVAVAVDAVAIYAFKGNPVEALSLAELARLFGREPLRRWGGLGLAGEWADRPVACFGLEPGRGAFELFREVVLGGGEFAGDIQTEPVSTSVVQGVATQGGGIGYASVFFQTQRTRIVPIRHQGAAVSPTAADALAGRYPLARFLYVIANRPSPAGRALLAFLLSQEGQDVIAAQGFYPLDGARARQGLEALP